MDAAPTPRWFVRVEQFVDVPDSSALVSMAARALNDALSSIDGAGPASADQGTGMADPVVGLTFVLPAAEPAAAVAFAVDLAARALNGHNRALYGVTVISEQLAPADRPDGFPIIGD